MPAGMKGWPWPRHSCHISLSSVQAPVTHLPSMLGCAELTSVGVPIETYFMHQLFNSVEVKWFMLCISPGGEQLSWRWSRWSGKRSTAMLNHEEGQGRAARDTQMKQE